MPSTSSLFLIPFPTHPGSLEKYLLVKKQHSTWIRAEARKHIAKIASLTKTSSLTQNDKIRLLIETLKKAKETVQSPYNEYGFQDSGNGMLQTDIEKKAIEIPKTKLICGITGQIALNPVKLPDSETIYNVDELLDYATMCIDTGNDGLTLNFTWPDANLDESGAPSEFYHQWDKIITAEDDPELRSEIQQLKQQLKARPEIKTWKEAGFEKLIGESIQTFIESLKTIKNITDVCPVSHQYITKPVRFRGTKEPTFDAQALIILSKQIQSSQDGKVMVGLHEIEIPSQNLLSLVEYDPSAAVRIQAKYHQEIERKSGTMQAALEKSATDSYSSKKGGENLEQQTEHERKIAELKEYVEADTPLSLLLDDYSVAELLEAGASPDALANLEENRQGSLTLG